MAGHSCGSVLSDYDSTRRGKDVYAPPPTYLRSFLRHGNCKRLPADMHLKSGFDRLGVRVFS